MFGHIQPLGGFSKHSFQRAPRVLRAKGQLLSQLQAGAREISREETHPGMLWGAGTPLGLNTEQDHGMEHSVTVPNYQHRV